MDKEEALGLLQGITSRISSIYKLYRYKVDIQIEKKNGVSEVIFEFTFNTSVYKDSVIFDFSESTDIAAIYEEFDAIMTKAEVIFN